MGEIDEMRAIIEASIMADGWHGAKVRALDALYGLRARAEAAEQRAAAAEAEVARVRAGWAAAAAEVAAMGAEPERTGQVLTERRSPATRAALREVARMLAEAQPAEVSDE